MEKIKNISGSESEDIEFEENEEEFFRESKSQLKLEKFFKMENQIMTSNNSIQLCKLESIGNEKKGMCYI